MGFCFFNNVAIAAAYLIRTRGLRRVMIIDWDLHHGNGTQDIFYDSPEVLYTSIHQYPFYPGSGAAHEMGTGAGEGYTVNSPLPAGFGDAEYLDVFDQLILPIGRKFSPEFILVSSGFDCHFRDPLGEMRVTEEGFAAMARRTKRLAAECCASKLVAALEGGYDLEALAGSGRAVIEEFGRDPDEPLARRPEPSRAMPLIEQALEELSPFWRL
jgi:acetoin utilization deacetylase AcuC-like enzyme